MNDKITAAKVDAVLDPNLCFFGSLLCNLKFQEDPTCKTTWTDGTNLGFNPAYIETLPHAEIVGLLAHEALHCASGHPFRRDNREPKKWNIACDLAINQVITESGLALPKGSLTADTDQHGKSAEWIYDRLPDNPDDSGNGDGSGNGAPGEVRDSPKGQPGNDDSPANETGTGEEADNLSQADWEELARQAAVQAKQRGKLPAGMERYIKAVAQAKVDWKSTLRKFVQENAKSDYTWTRPSNRFAGQGIYLPSMRSTSMPPIAIAVDTSGSMDDTALAQAKAEVEAVIDEVSPDMVHVLYADAKVARHDVFERGESLVWSPAGFGGTDFRPVFKAVADMDVQPTCIIYITDLCGDFPESSDIPTLWITDTNYTAPFGDTIRIA